MNEKKDRVSEIVISLAIGLAVALLGVSAAQTYLISEKLDGISAKLDRFPAEVKMVLPWMDPGKKE